MEPVCGTQSKAGVDSAEAVSLEVRCFAKPNDETIEMTVTKRNTAEHGFNLWAINDAVSTSHGFSLHDPLRLRLNR